MSIVVLEWACDYVLIDCPSYISDKIDAYQQQFDIWLSDRSNNHGYWVSYEYSAEYFIERGEIDPYEGGRDPDGKDGLSFGAEAFVNWLNEYILNKNNNEEAKIIWYDMKSDYSDNGWMSFKFPYARIRF